MSTIIEEIQNFRNAVRANIAKGFGAEFQKSQDDELGGVIEKAVYADTAENRKLGRVGKEYHRGNGRKQRKEKSFTPPYDLNLEAIDRMWSDEESDAYTEALEKNDKSKQMKLLKTAFDRAKEKGVNVRSKEGDDVPDEYKKYNNTKLIDFDNYEKDTPYGFSKIKFKKEVFNLFPKGKQFKDNKGNTWTVDKHDKTTEDRGGTGFIRLRNEKKKSYRISPHGLMFGVPKGTTTGIKELDDFIRNL